MLKHSDRTQTDRLARAQLAMLHGLADEIRLTPDDLRRALNLDDRTWDAWTRFQAGNRLPADPPLPEMLCRISETAHRLAVVARCATTHPDAARQPGVRWNGATLQPSPDWDTLAGAGRTYNAVERASGFQSA